MYVYVYVYTYMCVCIHTYVYTYICVYMYICIHIYIYIHIHVYIPGGSDGKCLPVMQGSWVSFLGLEDPLEKEMATHSSTLAWKIPWMGEPDRLQSMVLQRVGHN